MNDVLVPWKLGRRQELGDPVLLQKRDVLWTVTNENRRVFATIGACPLLYPDKADPWDGGHRIPLLCRWPARVKAGSRYDHTTCLVDLMATCSEMVGAKRPADAGEDSVSMLPALLGQTDKPMRETTVHHSISGKFSIRQGKWKLELCSGSGGWASPNDSDAKKQGLPEIQLYDMTADVGEMKNLQAEQPEVVKELSALLEKQIAEGRSTPGAPQKNDVEIDLWKKAKPDAGKGGGK